MPDEKTAYRRIIDKMPDGFAYLKKAERAGHTPDYIFEEVNPAFEEISGFAPEELIHQSITEVLPAPEGGWEEALRQLETADEASRWEQCWGFVGKWVEITCYLNSPGTYVLMARDVTSRYRERETLEALVHLPEKALTGDAHGWDYQLLTDRMQELTGAKYALLNLREEQSGELVTVAVSGAAEGIKEAEAVLGTELVGRKWAVSEDTADEKAGQLLTGYAGLHELVAGRLPGQMAFMLSKMLQTGEAWVRKVIYRGAYLGNFIVFLPPDKTLKSQEKMENYAEKAGSVLACLQELKSMGEGERRFRNAFDALEEVYYSVSLPDYRLLYINAAASSVYGYTPQELMDDPQRWLNLIKPGQIEGEPTSEENEANLDPSDKSLVLEYHYRHPDGSRRKLRERCWLVEDAAGKPVRQEGVVSDCTPKQEATTQSDQEREKHLEFIYHQVPLALFQIDEDLRIQEVNQCASTYTGKAPEEMLKRRPGEALDCQYLLDNGNDCGNSTGCNSCHLREVLQDTVTGGKSYYQKELRHALRKQGEHREVSLLVTATPLENRQSKAMVCLEDITEWIQAQEYWKQLTLYDRLTGLYNRTFFEEEMRRLSDGREYPITIVFADVDNLKLTNDSMGHRVGDEMIKACGEIMSRVMRSSDILARGGGDEFLALLPQTGEKAGANIVKRIEEEVQRYNREAELFEVSLSVGLATAKSDTDSLEEVFKRADEAMYRKKLAKKTGVAAGGEEAAAVKETGEETSHHDKWFLEHILSVLEERDYLADGHAQRLSELCCKVGGKIGLSDEQIKKLELLAQVHDLGYLGVPKEIISKEGLLSQEEWEIISQHPEKGYSLAQCQPELSGIAELILKHHERMDGKGYPLGIKGEKIPVECRILAIADAFDAMISDRPYRKAMSPEEAKAELRKHAGTRYDPELVEVFFSLLEEQD